MLSVTAALVVEHAAGKPILTHGSKLNLNLLCHKPSLKSLLLLASHPT